MWFEAVCSSKQLYIHLHSALGPFLGVTPSQRAAVCGLKTGCESMFLYICSHTCGLKPCTAASSFIYIYTSIYTLPSIPFLVLHRVSERQFVVLRRVAKACFYTCSHMCGRESQQQAALHLLICISLCVSTWSLCQQQAALYTSKFEDLCVLRHGAGQRECEEVGQEGP